MGLAVSEADFYLVKDSFISILASVLKINPRYINIVDVVPGNARRELSKEGDAVLSSHSRTLLAESITISFEVNPEASLTVDDTSVLENAGFAHITIRRLTNVSHNLPSETTIAASIYSCAYVHGLSNIIVCIMFHVLI
jgi:hypothetical protein